MAERQISEAEASFVAGRLDEVAEICGDLIAADPDCHQAFYLLGRTCMSLGKFDEAREMIEQATRIRSDAAPYHTELGNLLASSGQLDEAAASYRRAITLAPDFVDPRVNLGAALQLLDRNDEAMVVYREATELVPDAAALHFNLAEAYAKAGDDAAALDGYRRAVELEPEWADLQRNYGMALLVEGNIEAAEAACRNAVSLVPEDADNQVALARALVAAGDNRGALAVCDAYLASHSFHVAVAACRALVLNETGSRDATARLLGLESFVQLESIAPPVAFGSLSDFNEALSRETTAHFTPEYDPALRVVEGGRQSGERFVNPGAAVALLMERIDEAVREFASGFDTSDSNPFLARKPRKWRLKGYSAELSPDGHIITNIRPEAWMSGLYCATSGGAPEVTLGAPPASWNFAADPVSRILYPEAGEMLLYPSHDYCGVSAGNKEGCLLYAFQIVRE
tara:strand:+ start:274 stop:1641 length:1368 start_codon:yes stop_codon:yes gene_type:complete